MPERKYVMEPKTLNFFLLADFVISICLSISLPGSFFKLAAFFGFYGIFLLAILLCSEILEILKEITSVLKTIKDNEIVSKNL